MVDRLEVLFCADPLTPSRVDGHFAEQAATVTDLGGSTALIDHDALLAGDAAASVRRVPRDSGPWWYRGWMIPSKSYSDMEQALHSRGVSLRVPTRRYRAAHELPGWYATFRSVTPKSVWMPWTPGRIPTGNDILVLLHLGPGPAIVKDFVKSRKHEWQTACFIPDCADTAAATAVVARMVELQDDFLNGGIVLRRFEEYRQEAGRTVEARVWWVDGVPVLTTPHPDTPDLRASPDLTAVAPLVHAIGCPFVTTDLAQRTDGEWRVVEVGDGQVSDMPPNADTAALFPKPDPAHHALIIEFLVTDAGQWR